MGMRVTTNMAMNLYRYNLGNSTVKMNDAMNKVMSHRKFDSFAEDPTSAVQAWRVRRAMVDNNSYRNNNSDVKSRLNVAFATMDLINTKLVREAAKHDDLRSENEPTGGARVQGGQVLSNTADSIIQAMNSAKYSDHYVFSGTDEMNAPFYWDGQKLYYRGVNVNAGAVKDPAARELPEWVKNASGNEIAAGPMVPKGMPASSEDPEEQAWINYYSDPAITDQPASTVPAWADEGLVAGGAATGTAIAADDGTMATAGNDDYKRVTPEGMPASSEDVYEQAWIDYYNDPTTAYKPNVGPNELGNAWGEADQFGVPEATKNVSDNDTAYNRLWAEYYRDQGDLARLDMMSKEEQNVDLGMGLMKDENGNLVHGSAFNRALPGINMLGYGVDENGDPNNVVMVIKRLGEIFSNCDPESGYFDNGKPDGEPSRTSEKALALEAEADRLMDKLKLCNDNCNTVTAEISTKVHYLNENEERMKLQADYLEEDRFNLEEIDPADAISTFMYDYYCYNAALKVGTQLLSQSLIDYMN